MTTTKQNLAEKATTTQAKPKEEKLVPAKQKTEIVSLDYRSVAASSLEALADEYKGLVVEDTTDSIKAAKNARKALREPRYAIQNEEKEKVAFLNQVKGKIHDAAEMLISITRPVEDEIHGQIKAIEEKKQKEKEERDRLERERKEKLEKDSINFYTEIRNQVQQCSSEKDLNKLLKEVENKEIPDFEEFTNMVSININNILTVEIPNRRYQIQRDAEYEKLKAEQKEKDEELAKLKAKEVVEEKKPEAKPKTPGESEVDYDTNVKEELLEAVNSIYMLYSEDSFQEGSKAYIIIKTCEGMLEDVKKKTIAMINDEFPDD